MLTKAFPRLPVLVTDCKNIKYTHYKVCDEITYQFSNFNGATAEVWELISNFIPHITGNVITYPFWDQS